MNVFFATEAERNHDFASIVDSFGNDYRDPRLEHIEAEDLDNALSYLVNQQGHSVAELYSPLPEGKGDSPFIESVRQEISENSSEAMSNLAVLLRMDGNEMLRFLDARDKGERSLMLPKDYATVGIFNQWSGCGGVLDIQLEKDAVLPLSMAWDFSIEGNGSSNRWGGYTVDEVYGLVGSMWQSSFGFVTSLQPAVRRITPSPWSRRVPPRSRGMKPPVRRNPARPSRTPPSRAAPHAARSREGVKKPHLSGTNRLNSRIYQ